MRKSALPSGSYRSAGFISRTLREIYKVNVLKMAVFVISIIDDFMSHDL